VEKVIKNHFERIGESNYIILDFTPDYYLPENLDIKKDCLVFVLISGFRSRKGDKDLRSFLKWLLFRPNAYLKIKNEKNIRMILFDTDHRFLKELLGENASKIDIFNENLDWIDVSNYLDKENINILNLDLSNTTNTTISNNYGLDEESLGKLKEQWKLEVRSELKEELKKELKKELQSEWKLDWKDNLKGNSKEENQSLFLTGVDPLSDITNSFLRFYKSLKEMKWKE